MVTGSEGFDGVVSNLRAAFDGVFVGFATLFRGSGGFFSVITTTSLAGFGTIDDCLFGMRGSVNVRSEYSNIEQERGLTRSFKIHDHRTRERLYLLHITYLFKFAVFAVVFDAPLIESGSMRVVVLGVEGEVVDDGLGYELRFIPLVGNVY